MSAAGSYAPAMPNRTPPADPGLQEPGVDPADPGTQGEPSAAEVAAALPIAGLTRQRLLWLAAALVTAWLCVAIVRQVGDTAAVTDRADALRSSNAALRGEVASLDRELQAIQDPSFVAIQARAHRLGSSREVPFALEVGAPPLPADAPGSRSVALGAASSARSPLETWLTVLFGPGD
jgi:hypothetical protein